MRAASAISSSSRPSDRPRTPCRHAPMLNQSLKDVDRRPPPAPRADARPVHRRRVERRAQGPPRGPRQALPGLSRHLLDRHEPPRPAGALRGDEPPRRLGLRAGVHPAGRHGAAAPRARLPLYSLETFTPLARVRRARLHAAVRPVLHQRADDARSGRHSAGGRASGRSTIRW